MTDYLGDLGRIASDNAATYSNASGSPHSPPGHNNNSSGAGGVTSSFDTYTSNSMMSGSGSGALVEGPPGGAGRPGTQEGRPAPPTLVPDVRHGVSRMRFAPYIKNFDEDAAAAAIAMCTVPTQTIEDAARAQLLTFDIQREDQAMQHRNNIIKVKELRRNRLTELDTKRAEHHTLQVQSLRAIGLVQQQTADLVNTYYELAEREMDIHLTSRKSEVERTIGEIRKWHYADYDPNKPDWDRIEQEVQIEICKLRGIKNKVPRGRYVLLLSKWEKLGLDAEPLRWSKRSVFDSPPPPCAVHLETKNLFERLTCEVCTGRSGSTHIVQHEGLATDYELKFARHTGRTFTHFPAASNIKPYNVMVFELARLPELSEWREDQPFRPIVVGWGAMPIVDSKFEVVTGKFRLPMLRGPYKPEYGHYSTMQDAITGDIENWLCNLYVDIYPHARKYYGESEFDLERKFARNLLNLNGYPSAHDQEGWPLQKKKRGLSLKGSLDPLADLRNRTSTTLAATSAKRQKFATTTAGNTAQSSMTMGGGTTANNTMMGGTFGTTMGMFDDEEFPYTRPQHVPAMETDAQTRWAIIRLAVMHHIEEKRRNALDAQRDAIKRVEQQKRFRYAIHPMGAANIRSVWSIQVDYCWRAIVDELALDRPLSLAFWANFFVFVVCLIFQIYVHGLFVYFALYLTGTPVQKLEPRWFGLDVVYSHLKTYQVEELFVVFASMASTFFFLMAEIFLGYLLKRFMGHMPERLSKFVFHTASSAMLVPFIEAMVDVGDQTVGSHTLRRSDWYRLYDFFTVQEYGVYYTGLIWFLIYGLLIFLAIITTFLYTMRLHLNGILQDAFWRIMVVNESTCFLPDDLEISVSELQHILLHSERWRGKSGERRKIIVERLTTTDAKDTEYKRQDMHIRVVQLACGNSRRWWHKKPQTVHREFFITEDGTVLELMDGDGGGSQGMSGAAVGIGFLLNNLANTMTKKTMEAWGGALQGVSSGDMFSNMAGGGGDGGGGGGGMGAGATGGGAEFGMFGLGGGMGGASPSGGSGGGDLDDDEALDAGDERGRNLRAATTTDRAGGTANFGMGNDFSASFSASFY